MPRDFWGSYDLYYPLLGHKWIDADHANAAFGQK
jgi:hypothetical protein